MEIVPQLGFADVLFSAGETRRLSSYWQNCVNINSFKDSFIQTFKEYHKQGIVRFLLFSDLHSQHEFQMYYLNIRFQHIIKTISAHISSNEYKNYLLTSYL